MKNINLLIVIILSLLTSFATKSQDVWLTSQAQVDAFWNPSIISGYLFIGVESGSSDITDLSNLSNLNSIGGTLFITHNDNLSSLNGLSNLTSVGESLRISNNNSLTNLNGLSNLSSVPGFFEIDWNQSLTNLEGLSNINSIGEFCVIWNNYSLTNLNGLSSLSSIEEFLIIEVNPALINIDGLSGLSTIGEYIKIESNTALTNINGLSNLNSINGNLDILANYSLTNIDGLSNVSSIGGNLNIQINHALSNINGLSNLSSINGDLKIGNRDLTDLNGLSNLSSIGGDLQIWGNNSLIDLNGLSNINSIPGDLLINRNDVLANLNGLSNLTSIGGGLQIWINPTLPNLDGLSNLNAIPDFLEIRKNISLENLDALSNLTSVGGDLNIYDNDALTDCCGIRYLLEPPGIVGGTISIHDNPSECSNVEDIIQSSCSRCWDTGTLSFCVTSEKWEAVEGEENKIQATDIISVNDFLFFEGTMIIDTVILELEASGEFYVDNIPLPSGGIGNYSLADGSYSLKLLGEDGVITDFLNSQISKAPKLFNIDLTLDELQLVFNNNETGLKITCTIEVPGISGDCGDSPGGTTEIQLDGIGITTAGITLDGVNVKDLGMYVPGFCLNQLNVHYDSPKDILTAGAGVTIPFGEIAGGFKLEEGLIDSIGWKLEASAPPFVLGATTIGIKGFYGHISSITKPNIEIELGGIFSDILSDDLYLITASGKTIWPTEFEVAGTGQFMRPVLNTLPFQLHAGVSMGYNIPNKLFKVTANGSFGTLDEENWLMSGEGLLRVNHRTENTTFNGYFNGQMNVTADLFVNDPPMPIPYIVSLLGLPFAAESNNTLHYGNRKNFFGSVTIEHFILGTYSLRYLIDLTLPMDHKNYFFWEANKESTSRSLFSLNTELIDIPPETDYTIVHIKSENTPPTSSITSPSGKIYSTSSEEDRILYSENIDGKETFWTIMEPETGTWMIDLNNPVATDSVFYYNAAKINELEFSVEQNGNEVIVSWDPTSMETGETIHALLDDNNNDFDGFLIAEKDATEGSLSFTLDASTPDCQYYLYVEHIKDMSIQQTWADIIINNADASLAPPQNFRADYISQSVGFNLTWDASPAEDIAGYIITASDNEGNDSVYATLHPTETSINLIIENFENNSLRIESYDEDWSVGCPAVLDTLTENCIVAGPNLIETICLGDSYSVGSSTYSSSGNFSDHLMTADGCDSIVHLNLTVVPLDTTLSVTGGVIITNEENASSYQWFDCDSGEDIDGADQHNFTPTQTGNYAVRLEKDGCEKTSDCIYITSVSDLNHTGIQLYPNPNYGVFTIELSSIMTANLQLAIFNVLGEEVYRDNWNSYSNTKQLDLSSQGSGVYMIIIWHGDLIAIEKFVIGELDFR